MPKNKQTRLYRIVQYNLYVYDTTKKKTKAHFESVTGLKSGRITWSRYKKIKLSLNEFNK